MPTQCSVRGCKVAGGHRFPRDVIKKRLWLAAIRRKNYNPSERAVVCKKHFTPEDFTLPKDSVFDNPSPVLKKDAVPSVFKWDFKCNNKLDMFEEATNQDVSIGIKPVANDESGLTSQLEAIRPATPPNLVQASYKSGLRAGAATIQPIPKLRRVPNNPSLIARLEAARKSISVRPTLSSAACKGLQAGLDADSQAKLLGPSLRCFAYPQVKKEPKLTEQTQAIRPKLNVQPKVGYQMNHHPVIPVCQNSYGAPGNIHKVKVEKEVDSQENENLTHFTANPAAEVDSFTFVDCIMSEDIKERNGNFVAVEIGCVKEEFESRFKDKEIQCNIGDPCCSIFSNRKRPCSDQKVYSISSLSNNLKKRRISV